MSNNKERQGYSRMDFLKAAGTFGLAGYLLANGVDVARAGIKETGEDFLANHEVSKGDTSRKVILMTYDDFNSHENINLILDAYKEHNFKTTFFFPGGYDRRYITIGRYAEEIQRIVDEGHVFGCHGLIHEPYTTYNSDQIRRDIEQWLGAVQDIIPGYQVGWMRYPFGDRNQRTREIFAEYSMQSVMWSVESGGQDEATYSRVTSHAAQGEIVLNHTQRYYDAHQAHRILDFLAENNYSVESMATGLKPEDYFQTNKTPKFFPKINTRS